MMNDIRIDKLLVSINCCYCWNLHLMGSALLSMLYQHLAFFNVCIILSGNCTNHGCHLGFHDDHDAGDMRHRMAIAGERSRSLDHLWRDIRLPRPLKMRL